MGGPAMIEGGGLGVFAPEDVGPIDVQDAAGVVDLRVADDAAAVAAAKRYLSYFNSPDAGAVSAPGAAEIAGAARTEGAAGTAGALDGPGRARAADQAALRELIPANRKRVYDIRQVVSTLFDTGSVLELRRGFAAGIVTALARVDGRALGVIGNDPTHLGGAIDADGADKAARFMQLCDAFALPIVSLCDTPGFMVGPDAERTGTVRHFSRMFVTGASLTVPVGTVVLRKGYGLGAQAMATGGFKEPQFVIGWPTSEFGAMGLEGAVRLGMRRELDAISDPEERNRVYEATVAAAYDRGQGINMASYFEIDDVIDPADTRRWISTLFSDGSGDWRSSPGKRRPCVDAW
jgi:acetyl-CoA carboxylase carboxyltransferase component